MNLPHLPALRRGKPYESLDKVDVLNHRTGQPMAVVSQVGAGILRKDLSRLDGSQLEALTASLRKHGLSDNKISAAIVEAGLKTA